MSATASTSPEIEYVREIELVNSLTTRTKLGKIHWEMRLDRALGRLSEQLYAEFLFFPLPIGRPIWRKFSVRDLFGNVLVLVEAPELFRMLPRSRLPLRAAVDRLFAVLPEPFQVATEPNQVC